WDVAQSRFTGIAPEDTYEFYRLAESVKTAGFKIPVLDYLLTRALAADSNLGLASDKGQRTGTAVRDTAAAIDQDHPDVSAVPLTTEIVAAKLALTYKPDIVARFVGLLNHTASFETVTDNNLNIVLPDPLGAKFSYVKASGRLTCLGIMSD